MMVLGWNLVTLPSFPPAPTTIEYQANEIVGATTNPFTAQKQTYQWQAFWQWSVAYPPMKESDADNWIAFLLSLQGVSNVFQLGDPRKTAPRGTPTGVPRVNGYPQSGYNLITSGWTPNSTGNLLPGDYFNIGYRMYQYVGDGPLNADSMGFATIPIWPPLRETPNGGNGSPPTYDLLSFNNCKGLWKLNSNSRKWLLDRDRYYKQIAFEIMEAL